MSDHKKDPSPEPGGLRPNRSHDTGPPAGGGGSLGVRELKTHASRIVREVREHQAQYVVTHRGEPVGVLLPIAQAPRPAGGAGTYGAAGSAGAAWEELERLGAEIGRGWRSGRDSRELLDELRR